MSGEQFGPYLLEGLLGEGGMGEVHRAYDTGRNRVVALKRMPARLGDDPGFRSRFGAEARVAARMRNPHVIPIHDYGQIDGQPFIDMRLVDGEDLKTRLERRGPLGPEAAVAMIAQVASALDAAHAEGLVHRDVKPSNVLLTEPDDFVYLIDFGLARELTAARVTSTGVTFGTLAYMAPERFDGAGDYRVDVYALGCILYEALTGVAPFPHQDFLPIMHAHLATPPPRPSLVRPGVPPALDAVVARGMHKDPARRYQRAGELAAAAKAALAAGSHPAFVHPAPPPVPRPALPAAAPIGAHPGRRRPRPPGVLAGLVIAPVVVIALALLVVIDDSVGGPEESLDSALYEPLSRGPGSDPEVIARIQIGSSPRNLAVSADGTRLYATNREDDSVSVVDTASASVVRTLDLAAGNGPEGIAVTPDERTAFVVNHGASTVDVIDSATGAVRRTVRVDESPTDVAVTPDGRTAYVTTNDGGTLLAVDADAAVQTVLAGERPQSLAVSADGATAYVTDGGTETLLVVDTADGEVTAEVPVGSEPDGVALSPDGTTAYVVNLGDDTVSVVDIATATEVAVIEVGTRPVGVAVHPDGDTVYVTNNDSSTISVIDTATRTAIGALVVGLLPEAVAVAPDGDRVYVVNAGDGTISVIDTARY